MKNFSRLLALIMCLAMLFSVAVISANAIDEDVADVAAEQNIADTSADGVTVHVYAEDYVPYIYYWNTLPSNITCTYPGVQMTKSPSLAGGKWYTYTFSGKTKVNFLITNGTSGLSGQKSSELTRNAGEWWFYNNRFRSKNPFEADSYDSVDMRQDTIYFVITTRFYDGDKSNNVFCWDHAKANNADSDPEWRGDFKGLADKLDYIKAMGFSAIWITPVTENASGYDYHGYHSMNFSKVDARYESDDFTYEDLIAAAHDKGIKIVQDVVWNHTGNFGENYIEHLFDKDDSDRTKLGDMKSTMIPTKKLLDYCGLTKPEEYWQLPDGTQYDKRLQLMKQTKGFTDMVSTDPLCDSKNYYHNGYFGDNYNWDDYTCKFHQIAGDCVDLNTENKAVADYTVDAYSNYLDMGVDAFRVDTVRHISRLSLNKWYNDRINTNAKSSGNNNFYMFGEICCRVNEIWNRNTFTESVPYYTWDDSATDLAKLSDNTDPASVKTNLQNSIAYNQANIDVGKCPTSTNAFLNGISYHTPDYSKSSGMGAIDFCMHWNFDTAGAAFGVGQAEDQYINDSTWNVVYVQSHDYGCDGDHFNKTSCGTQAWAEKLNLMFTFRGIPCLYYGDEVEFQKGLRIDEGTNITLANSGRAYFGDRIEGTVNTTGFSQYNNATGAMATTLNSTLAKHIQKLNAIRRAVPALQLGQYTTNSNYVSGNMAFIRRYTGSYTNPVTKATSNVDSIACVAISGGATFKNIPAGTYVDLVTGDRKTVTNGGTLSVGSLGGGNMRVYVLNGSGAVGPGNQTYLK